MVRPLTAAAIGLVLVLVDFRIRGVDLCVDAAGWALMAWCLWRLHGPKAAAPAVAGTLFSLSEVRLPYHYVLVETYAVTPSGTPYVAEVEMLEHDKVSGLPLAAMALATICLAVVVIVLTRMLAVRAGPSTTDPALRVMRLSAVATVALWTAPRVVGMVGGAVGDGFDPVWNDPVWRVELAGLLAGATLAASLFTSRREPWAIPRGERRLGNWTPAPGPDPT